MGRLQEIRNERQKRLGWKNIAPIKEALDALPFPDKAQCRIGLGDAIEIESEAIDATLLSRYEALAKRMMPWRKGPFRINDLFIDSEWRSYVKYNLLLPHMNLEGKDVADIGCNNGYYLFRMLAQKPASLTGFDPSALFFLQFSFIDRFVQSGITYELLGVEHLPLYEKRFDTIFCLGVLYHRSDPVATLKALHKGLNEGGELFLDTFMIEGEEEVALTPRDRYSKIPNIYFIPTVKALENWCLRAGFKAIEVLSIRKTDPYEQRKTEWIDSQSLEDFLDPEDSEKTVEGYPAPRRVYIRAIK